MKVFGGRRLIEVSEVRSGVPVVRLESERRQNVDRTTVVRARSGDRAAYEELARLSADRLFAVCHRIAGDADVASDALQRTLVGIWQDLPGLRDPDRFEAWTYRLAVRFSVDELRRSGRPRPRVRELTLLPSGATDPFAEIEVRESLESAFRRLRPDHRVVVVLRYYLGLPLDEIARCVGVPVGTVGSRLHYALSELRRALEDQAEPTGAPREKVLA